MYQKVRLPALVVVMSSLALISACGGGGGSAPTPSPPPPPPPPVNTAPVFATQSLSTNEEVNGSAQLAASDAQSNALTFAIATQPQHGTATLTATGALSYAPAANYFGSDSLTVTVTDSGGLSTTGTVNITVTNVNDAPVVQNDQLRVTVTPGQSIVLTTAANDTDADGDALTPTIVTQPAHGGTIAVDAATRVVTFQPANGYVGPIEFSYRVNDGTVDSAVATVRAVIGEFESLMFMSDYTTPGLREVHVYDGLDIRRVSDPVPAGGTITTYSVSNDSSTLAYVVSSSDADRVYVKSLTGNAPAAVRYESAKPVGATFGVSGALNADGTHMWVYDGYYAFTNGPMKEYFVFDTATGTARRLAGDMIEIIDIRLLQWHTHEANLLMVQGQTAGNIPLDQTSAMSAYVGNAFDVRTLFRIGLLYASGEHGSGEGFYFGANTNFIYHTEYKRIGADTITNLLRYDRLLNTTAAVVRTPAPPDRGMNGVVGTSPGRSRICFGYYEASTTTNDGPSKFYAADMATLGSEMPVTSVLSDITTCQFASDNRTMIFRVQNSPARIYQQAFAIDSVTPGTIRPLVPSGEAGNEQAGWQAAPNAMRIAVAFFNYDGVAGVLGQSGRYYSMSADGTGDAFLFADNYQFGPVSNFFASNADGSFIIHSRTQGGVPKLELMSTHGLNLSIPLAAAGETLGVQSVRWLRRY